MKTPLAALVLAGLATAATASETTRFVCTAMGDGNYSVYLAPETPDKAIAIYELGIDSGNTSSEITLKSAITGSGFRYVGDGIEFRGKGEVATLTDGAMQATCVVYIAGDEGPGAATVDAATPDTAAGPEGTTTLLAMGGNLRSGPGTEHGVVGALRYGTPVALAEDTGVVWNGYTWFRIRRENGDTGYVWGGIMCAPDGGVAGVLDPCR